MLILAHAFSVPPLHAVFVNFTAGLIPTAFVFDLLAAIFKKDSLRAAAWWTLLLAAIITPLTAAAGWWWLLAEPEEHAGHWQMPIHQWLGTAAAVLLIPIAVWRGRLYKNGTHPGWAYAFVAVVFLAALCVQGDLGGSMSFGEGIVIKHGAEQTSAPAATAPAHSH